MKVRMGARATKSRATPGADRGIWLIGSACISLVSVLGIVGVIHWEDAASTSILLLVSLGAVRADSLVDKFRLAERDEASVQMTPERVLLAHLKSVLRIGLWSLGARSVALRLWDRNTGQALHWNWQRTEEAGLEMVEPEAGVRPLWPEFESAIFVRKGAALDCVGVGQERRPIDRAGLLQYLKATQHGAFETLMLGYLEAGRRWQGTVAFLDAPVPSPPDEELFKLQEVVGMAASALDSFQRVSDRVRMEERRRLARDLHDGVIQSLIATELQVALAARENALGEKTNLRVLGEIQETLRRETRKLRGQIEELQRGENSESVRCVFDRLVKKFEAETGISTSLVCAMRRTAVAPGLAFDLICLLQEALSNVRKHSSAKRVLVRVNMGQRAYLQVEDDGCGFDFSGRYDLAALRSTQRGPRTICERVEANGGDLILESTPGGGVRIEISLPLPATPDAGEDGTYMQPQPPAVASRRADLKKPPRSASEVARIRRVL